MTPKLRYWAGPALLLAWAAVTLSSYWGEWAVDLSAVYFAGNFFGEPGGAAIYNRVYDTPEGLKWVALRDALGFEGKTLAPYIYPPWVAGVMRPVVTAVGPQAFYNAGYALHIAALAVSVLLAARLFRPREMDPLHWTVASLLILVLSFPATFSIGLNQPQNLVNAMTLAAFVLARRGASFAGGGILAAAAAIKLSPAVFLVIFLAERNWRALAGFAAAGLAFVALNAWISPPGYTQAFLDTIARIGDEVLISRINHSVEAATFIAYAVATGAQIPDFVGYIWVPGPPWLDPLVKALLVTGLAWSVWATRALAEPLRLWLRFQLVAILAILLGPLGWTHYLILPFLGLPAVVRYWPGGQRTGWLIVAALTAAFSTPVFVNPIVLTWPEPVAKFWGLAWIFAWLGLLIAVLRSQKSADLSKNLHFP